MKRLAPFVVLFSFAGPGSAQGTEVLPSPYAGEESRPVKSLSREDIAELRRGGGWGLAKAAELNGVPGPAHLLELKDDIPLSADKVSEILAVFERMREDAIAEGARLLAGERALEEAFRARTVTKKSLGKMLADIERSRARLRYIHLVAHLDTPALLTAEQIARYRLLRGYDSQGCSTSSPRHDPKVGHRQHH